MTEHLNQSDYYSILNCPSSASFEELKQSYQELIRRYHPDKGSGQQDANIFLQIDKAWKTLRDKNLRREYDINLRTKMEFDKPLIYMEFKFEELQFNDKNKVHYPCRCGSSFIIEKTMFGKGDILVECDECSNCVLIKM